MFDRRNISDYQPASASRQAAISPAAEEVMNGCSPPCGPASNSSGRTGACS